MQSELPDRPEHAELAVIAGEAVRRRQRTIVAEHLVVVRGQHGAARDGAVLGSL